MRDGHKLATSTCPTPLSCSKSQHEVRKLLNVEPKDYVRVGAGFAMTPSVEDAQ